MNHCGDKYPQGLELRRALASIDVRAERGRRQARFVV